MLKTTGFSGMGAFVSTLKIHIEITLLPKNNDAIQAGGLPSVSAA